MIDEPIPVWAGRIVALVVFFPVAHLLPLQGWAQLIASGSEYAAIGSNQNLAEANVPEGRLLLHLEFEELKENRLIDSTGQNTNVMVQGQLEIVPGRVGNAANFASDDYAISIPVSGTDLELIGTSYTIAWWMKETNDLGGIITGGRELGP